MLPKNYFLIFFTGIFVEVELVVKEGYYLWDSCTVRNIVKKHGSLVVKVVELADMTIYGHPQGPKIGGKTLFFLL